MVEIADPKSIERGANHLERGTELHDLASVDQVFARGDKTPDAPPTPRHRCSHRIRHHELGGLIVMAPQDRQEDERIRMLVQKPVDRIERRDEALAAAETVFPALGITPGRQGGLDHLCVSERREEGLVLRTGDIKQGGKVVAMMPDAEFEAILARAAEKGAKRALADVGLDGDEAALDIRDLRSLVDCIRLVRRTAMQTAVSMITTGVMLALLAGIAIKLRIFGGGP